MVAGMIVEIVADIVAGPLFHTDSPQALSQQARHFAGQVALYTHPSLAQNLHLGRIQSPLLPEGSQGLRIETKSI
jgi:hypothetical protein